MAIVSSLTEHTTPGSTGQQTYAHGLGQTPQLIIVFTNFVTQGNTTIVNAGWTFGAADSAGASSGNQFCQGYVQLDGDTASDPHSWHYFTNDSILHLAFGATNWLEADDDGDWTSTNVYLNWSTVDAGAATHRFWILAMAGFDTAPEVGDVSCSGTSAVTVDDMAGKPQVIITCGGSTALDTAQGGYTIPWALSMVWTM